MLCEIERHSEAQESYMEDGLRLLELARDASQLFAQQAPNEKKTASKSGAVELSMKSRQSSRKLQATV